MPISTAALQQALLSLLCFNDEAAQLLARRLPTDIFLGRANKLIATTALEYIRTYNRAPGDQIELLLEKELRRGEDGKLLNQTLDLLKEQFSAIQPEFILKELVNFEEIQRMTIASQLALEELAQGNLSTAREALSAATRGPNGKAQFGSNELWLSDVRGMFGFLDKQDSDFFSSGVEAVDDVGARPERKTVSFMIAAAGKGKSWFLINVMKAAIQYHHTACYITLELSAEKAAKRLLQSIFSLTSSEVQEIRTPYFDRDVKGNMVILFRELKRDSLFNRRLDVQKRLSEFLSYPPLIIKEFPSGSLTIGELENYLDYLEKEQGVKPDILAIDYAQLMKLDSNNLRIDIGRLWVALRGVVSKRNMALVSASQGNREADTAKTVDRGHAAEDWSQIGTADIVWTFSQTPEEKKLGLSRILVAKSRDSIDRIMILNSQAYSVGQFSLDSVVMSRDVVQEIDRVTSPG